MEIFTIKQQRRKTFKNKFPIMNLLTIDGSNCHKTLIGCIILFDLFLLFYDFYFYLHFNDLKDLFDV